MASAFVSEIDGELVHVDGSPVTVILDYSKKGDDDGGGSKYWTAEKMIEQVVSKAIPAHESNHPDKQALFMFDHSTNHHAMPEDALIASRMNLRDGGKQPRLRATTFKGEGGKTVD